MADESKKNNFQNTVDSLFKGMDGFMTTKTVVGDAITVGDTIILPLVDVSFGMGATAKAEGVKSGGGATKLVNIKNQDSMTKILDMVPDFVNKFTSGSDADPAEKAETEE